MQHGFDVDLKSSSAYLEGVDGAPSLHDIQAERGVVNATGQAVSNEFAIC